MSIIKVDYGTISGGGAGATDTFTGSVNEQKTIQTGLSSINRIIFYFINPNTNYVCGATYWDSSDSSNYSAVVYASNTGVAANGSFAVGTRGAGQRCIAIMSTPSGGDIDIQMGDSATWASVNVTWIAC